MRRRNPLLLAAFALLAASALPAAAGTNFIINNTDPPGQGFNDPTVVAPVGGNPGTTLGAQRLNVFRFVADLWGSIIQGDVDIVVQGSFQPLPCTPTAAVLGQARAVQIFANFPGATFSDTWFQASLANKLAGFDLAPGPPDPGLLLPPFNDDIAAFFNSSIGTLPGCLVGRGWYYGFDNNHGIDFSLVHVLLHEFAHGLGFANFVTEQTGESPSGLTDVFSVYTHDNATGLNWNQMTPLQIKTSAVQCDAVSWTGPNVNSNLLRFIVEGLPSVIINSPASIAGGRRIGPASFGPPIGSPGVSGDVVLALDPSDPAGPLTTDGCSPLTNAAAVNGNIALIDRGTCTFPVKVANAQAAGARAVLIADDVASCPPAPMNAVDPTITIPSARLTLVDANAIKSNLPVNVRLGLDLTVLAGGDSAGRALLFATNPVQPGSSISHFEASATPNALMEPGINADLVRNQVDLTAWQLIDVGWDFASVVIGDCDTGVPNLPVPGNGTIGTLIDDCAALAAGCDDEEDAVVENHGGGHCHHAFEKCVKQATKALKKAGLITSHQRNAINHCADEAEEDDD